MSVAAGLQLSANIGTLCSLLTDLVDLGQKSIADPSLKDLPLPQRLANARTTMNQALRDVRDMTSYLSTEDYTVLITNCERVINELAILQAEFEQANWWSRRNLKGRIADMDSEVGKVSSDVLIVSSSIKRTVEIDLGLNLADKREAAKKNGQDTESVSERHSLRRLFSMAETAGKTSTFKIERNFKRLIFGSITQLQYNSQNAIDLPEFDERLLNVSGIALSSSVTSLKQAGIPVPAAAARDGAPQIHKIFNGSANRPSFVKSRPASPTLSYIEMEALSQVA
ncbi:hypothetical protein H0H93_012062 [Arthromyces matolae]|nr:hypothetical protein H0H93_012062 [Arthromyces matolae]